MCKQGKAKQYTLRCRERTTAGAVAEDNVTDDGEGIMEMQGSGQNEDEVQHKRSCHRR